MVHAAAAVFPLSATNNTMYTIYIKHQYFNDCAVFAVCASQPLCNVRAQCMHVVYTRRHVCVCVISGLLVGWLVQTAAHTAPSVDRTRVQTLLRSHVRAEVI